MLHPATISDFRPHRIETFSSSVQKLSAPTLTQELLPFTVRLVRNEGDLDKAVDIRHAAYARHLPEFAQTLTAPESADAENGVVVLLAESKLDGSPLGTMRIQTNQFKPLCLEQSVKLPTWLKTRRLAEATRLGVTNAKGGRLVTTVLFKAFFQYCLQADIEWMVVTGRAPVDRMYDRLLFDDVFPGVGYIPIHHVGNLPHRVMSFNVETAEERWIKANHPLLGFMCHTHHPDIKLGHQHPALSSTAAMPTSSTLTSVFPM
jgi:hypothetical protein